MDLDEEVEYLSCMDDLITAAEAVIAAQKGDATLHLAIQKLDEALKLAKEADAVLNEKVKGRDQAFIDAASKGVLEKP